MLNDEHLTEFAGLPVVEFPSRQNADSPPPGLPAALADPASVAWRLRVDMWLTDDEEPFEDYFRRFLAEVDTARVGALVVGAWDYAFEAQPPTAVRDLLVAHADRFPALRSLFFGDITDEELHISWTRQDDPSPLLTAFPDLSSFTLRGALTDVPLRVPEHACLRSLSLETGGLPAGITREVLTARLPALEHLDLVLGMGTYGCGTEPDTLAPLLAGEVHPRLASLGLRSSELTDTWVRALADAPLLPRLRVLDLSLGTLTDRGARVLLDTPAFLGLERLDLHHSYLSEGVREELRTAFAASGTELDLSHPQPIDDSFESGEDREEGETWDDYLDAVRPYYPAVGE
ncbi:STM4015 family protein [Nocardiopsis aegyptia]|uniref:STM4015 family protein n=1 Tax=Nocardiopsis aegyptia TaxID=220378 RepID=UPI00366FD2D5